MKYSCYKIKGSDISYYLEDSDYRKTTVTFDGFRYKGEPIKFAAKNNDVHIYDTNLNISKYFNMQGKPNSNGNFNAMPYGYSPVVRPVSDYSTIGKWRVVATRTTGSGFAPILTLERRSISMVNESSGVSSGIMVLDCPHVFFVTIQGAGGGGGSGGNIRFGGNIQGAGGGSGAVLPLIIKLPDNFETKIDLFKVGFGSGGTNSHGRDGTKGGLTTIYDLNDNIIATVEGGNGGIRGQYHNTGYYYPGKWYSTVEIKDNRLLSGLGIPIGNGGYIRIAPGFEKSKIDPNCESNIYSDDISTISLNGIAGKMQSYFYAYNKYFGRNKRQNKIKSISVGYTLRDISDGIHNVSGFSPSQITDYSSNDNPGYGDGLNGATSFVTLRTVFNMPKESTNSHRPPSRNSYKVGVGGTGGWTFLGMGSYPTEGTDATFGAGGGGGGRLDGIGNGASGGNGGDAAISIYF